MSTEAAPCAPVLETDVLVVGAGCAGLSLAVLLCEEAARRGVEPPSVTLLDPREGYARDRTFCYWNVARHRFEAAESRRWSAWSARYEGREARRESPGLAYVELDAGRFYDLAREALAGFPSVTLALGAQVTRLAHDGARVCAETTLGPVRARVAFDSRPPALDAPCAPGELRTLQHFLGWHVRVERDVFDPRCAVLMDFDVPQRPPAHFAYVLPYGPREALVEATWFSPELLPEQGAYARAVEHYLRARLGLDAWRVLREERGVLPMSTEPFGAHEPAPGVHRIGLGGGLAKPSTGYAFLAIQRQSAALARALVDALAREGPAGLARGAPPPPRSLRADAMDRVFLQYLLDEPARAPALLYGLFDRLPPATLVRFLSDEATALDALQVLTSVPSRAFAERAVRSAPAVARAARARLAPR